ncbi:MAG: acetolactate decarboxylase [Thiocapsa sp.]|uniref:acetolactate decarboxylase n=1 Tax=Thiocapsa sp. TaxID=2024551 RepID=UPI001BCD7D88|nr:acetolactate decarboxylase [Thiocapsa sp.]QVL48303.1 MAG: acetolactate decarboxylase [Thiocapsa sp.]
MRVLITGILIAVASCAQAQDKRDVLYQVSTIDALLSGIYDSVATVDDVLDHGGFGLGTFEAVDGEMMVLDGIVYQATFDGSMNVMPPSTGTPFMAVTHFEPDRVLDAPELENFAAFSQWLERNLPSRNIAYAVRVDGRFANITYRSVARQQRPFPPLVDVTRNQAVFERKDVEGTLMGFWCPAFMNGVNVAGLHLHFLSADRSIGGHVLDLSLNGAKVGIDDTNGWDVQLPMVPAYLNADLGADHGNDLKSAEQGGAVPDDTSAH